MNAGFASKRLRSGLLAALFVMISGTASAQDYEGEILARVNAMRSALGLNILTRDQRLDAAARVQSEYMASTGEVGHESETTGNPARRIEDAGVQAAQVAENVAMHTTAIGAHEALIASEPHRANLLNPNLTHVGIALAQGASGVYLTQVFARLDAVAGGNAAPNGQAVLAPPAPASPTVLPPANTPATGSTATANPQAPQTSQTVTAVSPGARRTIGYWVFSGGRWWYYPIPPGAQPGQHLQPDLRVNGPPPGYSNAPVQPGTRVVVRPPSGPAPAFGWSPRRYPSRWYWSY